MKKISFFIFFGVIISVWSIKAQNDTLLLYDYYYNNFKAEKFILYVDIRILEDSSKICTVFAPCNWYELISTIPLEFYTVKKKALICFFFGNEDYSKYEKDYVMKYIDTLKIYFGNEDKFIPISWEKKKIKKVGIGICDSPIFTLIIKDGIIIQESDADSRLYRDNYIHYYIDDNF